MPFEQKNSVFGLILVSILGYFLFGYHIPRTEFYPMFLVYSVLFAIYLYVLLRQTDKQPFKLLFFSGIVFRVILLFSTPELSDDFYRFFWDGSLMHNGLNPYTHFPSELIGKFEHSETMSMLYEGMNSKNYFSVYPPLAQFSYYLATFFSEKGIFSALIIYKLLILIAEIVLFRFFLRFLEKVNKPKGLAFIYFLNPLIILEFSGNLHGEVFVILGLVISSWFLLEKRYIISALAFGLAVSFKLLPLIFLPFIINFIGFRNGIRFSLVAFFIFILTFIPFIDRTLIEHMGESVGLYFNSFEFNSSISNVARSLTKWLTGRSLIPYIGKLMGISAFLLIIWYSLKPVKQNVEALFQRMSFLLFVYLLFANSIHPWYIAPIIAFSVLIPLSYGIIWSFLIFLTYITYSVTPYSQNTFLIGLEYLVILAVFINYKKKNVDFY